ncbi:MAG: ROK family protein, partial [Acidobacteria bacterium]|nr:ROK family protein [Acidobacteriota bacterium]
MRRTPSRSPRAPRANRRAEPRTLAIDVGGTGLKAAILDARGRQVGDRVRVPTPAECPPSVLVKTLGELVAPLRPFDRVSVGFPGVVRGGVIRTAPNFDSPKWRGFDLARALTRALKRPVRVLNDAEVQGLAVITGTGVELVITLGTGVGSALFRDGELMPHLELSQHPVHGGKTYDEYLGDRIRKRVGTRKWNRRVRRVLRILESVVNYDRLHLGGGNAARINFRLGRRARIVENKAGLLGGIALWRGLIRVGCLAPPVPRNARRNRERL